MVLRVVPGTTGNHWEPLVWMFLSHISNVFAFGHFLSLKTLEFQAGTTGNHQGTTGNHLEVIDSEIVRFSLPS